MTKTTNAAGQENCGNCHKCLESHPITRILLCPDCGNKRCPKASDHCLACTNSNKPDQPGSVYGNVPAAPSAVEEVEAWMSTAEIGEGYELALDLARRLEEAQKHLLRWIQTSSDWQRRAESAEAALREAQKLLMDAQSYLDPRLSTYKAFHERIQRHLDSRTGKEHG